MAAALAAALVTAACGGGDDGGSSGGSGGGGSSDPIKIGVALALTGTSGAIGEPQKKTLDLFKEQLDEQGGINGRPVEFIYVDTTSDEAQAVNTVAQARHPGPGARHRRPEFLR